MEERQIRTLFLFSVKVDLETDSFSEGNVRFGNLIALHKGEHLEMIY